MSAEIRVPTLGESIVDATIASWLKKEGDPVKRGDALVELETEGQRGGQCRARRHITKSSQASWRYGCGRRSAGYYRRERTRGNYCQDRREWCCQGSIFQWCLRDK